MKIGVISDLHLGYYPHFLYSVLDYSKERYYLDKVLKIFADEGVELIAILGDLLHTWRGRYGWLALMHFLSLLKRYRLPTFMVRGNHDVLIPQLYEELLQVSDGYFMTFVGKKSIEEGRPIWVEEEKYEGLAYKKVMALNDIRPVAVLPHAVSILPRGYIDSMRDKTWDMLTSKENPILLVHYFLESRIGGILGYVIDREFVVPDISLAKRSVTIFAGHDHRRYASSDGRYVIGSLFPRDIRLGGDDLSFGILEISDRGDLKYTPRTLSLPYKLVYSVTFDSLDEILSWIKENLQSRERLVIANLGIKGTEITLAQLENYLASANIDVRKVLIMRIVPISNVEEKRHVVELTASSRLSITDAFHEYIQIHKDEIKLPKGTTIDHINSIMNEIFTDLLKGEEVYD